MKINPMTRIIGGLLMGCAAFGMLGASAHAASPAARPSPIAGAESSAPLVLVAKKKWYYNKHRHGERRRHRGGRYRYEYDGFYYTAPFWLLLAPYAYEPDYAYDDYDDYDDYDGYDDAHVRYCLRRFKSYDIRTDSYMGYDHERHRCNSPFD